MNRLAVGIDLIELAGEKQTSVQAGLECTLLVYSTSSDFDSSQNFVPALFGGISYLFEAQCSDFLEIPPCLLLRYERRRDLDADLLSAGGLESYGSHDVVSFQFACIRAFCTVI